MTNSLLVLSELGEYTKKVFLSRKHHTILIICLHLLFSVLNFETCSLLTTSLKKMCLGKGIKKYFI